MIQIKIVYSRENKICRNKTTQNKTKTLISHGMVPNQQIAFLANGAGLPLLWYLGIFRFIKYLKILIRSIMLTNVNIFIASLFAGKN